jgi:minor extracellular protease Epr
MQRFSISLYSDELCDADEMSKIIGVESTCVVDGCNELCSDKRYPNTKALFFPEIGVCYANLTDTQLKRIRLASPIKKVLPVRMIGPAPHFFDKISKSELELLENRDEIMANLNTVRAPETWSLSTGKGVKIGILDTGIDRDHRDLPVVGGVSVIPGETDWDDKDGHGTHCAGIVGARKNDFGIAGVAPDCDLYAIKFHNGDGASIDQMIAGMTWAARNNMDVLSMSQWNTAGDATADEEPWEDVQRAAQLLIDNNCIVVGIAGNSGYGPPFYPTHFVTNPGRCPAILAVGAVHNNKQPWIGSSFGPETLPIRQGVEIVAPGVDILSTYNDGEYVRYTGTSMACPHVAGAAALIRQIQPTLTPLEIRQYLRENSLDIEQSGFDIKTGKGVLDCYAAVSAAMGHVAPE